MAAKRQYLVVGEHYEDKNGNKYKKGDTVTTDLELDKLFLNYFQFTGWVDDEPKPAVQATPQKAEEAEEAAAEESDTPEPKFKLVEADGGKFNVVDADGNVKNDKPLSKRKAELLAEELGDAEEEVKE